jgi:hypothetical protein
VVKCKKKEDSAKLLLQEAATLGIQTTEFRGYEVIGTGKGCLLGEEHKSISQAQKCGIAPARAHSDVHVCTAALQNMLDQMKALSQLVHSKRESLLKQNAQR